MQAQNTDASVAPERPESARTEDDEPLNNLDEARQEPGETQEKAAVAQDENDVGGASSAALSEGQGASGTVDGVKQRDAKDAAPVQEKEEMKNTDEGDVAVEDTATVESEAVKGEADLATAMEVDDTQAGGEVRATAPEVVEIDDDVEQPDGGVAELDRGLTDAESSAHEAASGGTIAAQSSVPVETRSEERGLLSGSADKLNQLPGDQNPRIDAAVADKAAQKEDAGEKEARASVPLESAAADQLEQDNQAAAEVEVVVIEQAELDAPADSAAENQLLAGPETAPAILITEEFAQPSVVVPEAAISSETQVADAASNQENTSEQWFGDADMSDNDGHLIPVDDEDPSVDDDDDNEPVFVGTSSAADTFQLETSPSKQKRKRPSSDDESDATHAVESESESSSGSGSDSGSSSESSSSSGSSGSESEDEASKRKAKTAKKARHKASSDERSRTAVVKPKKPRVAAPRTVPAQFKIFDNVSLDNREFPILRGSYVIKSNHRAVFTGNWGFCNADFTAGGDRLSKFEYTSIYLHGRHDSDRRPFSGKYGGYFNFRQFSGKIIKIKEEQVELNFVKVPGDDNSSESDDSDDDEAFAKCCYEVYGSGKNRFGRFLIRGFLSPATSKLVMRRHYLD